MQNITNVLSNLSISAVWDTWNKNSLYNGFTTGDYKHICQLITKYKEKLKADSTTSYLQMLLENTQLKSSDQYDLIKRMLDEKLASADEVTEEGNPILYTAIEMKNYDIIELLLQYGADPNAKDCTDRPLFRAAIWTYNLDIIRLLLEYKADPYATYRNLHRCFWEAHRSNHLDCVKILVQHGIKELKIVEDFCNRGGDICNKVALLQYAVYMNNHELVRYLIGIDVDPNRIDPKGNPLLHHFIQTQNLKMIKLFLEYGVDPNERSRDQCTPLIRAIQEHLKADPKQPEIIDLLIKYGASPINHLKDALQKNISTDALKLLVHYINDSEVTDEMLTLAIDHEVGNELLYLILSKFDHRAINKQHLWRALDKDNSEDIIKVYLSCVRTKLIHTHMQYGTHVFDVEQIIHETMNRLVDEDLMIEALEIYEVGSFTVMLNYVNPGIVSSELIVAALEKFVDEKVIHTLWQALAPGKATQEILELLVRKFEDPSLIKLFLQKAADDIDRNKILTFLLDFEVDAFDMLCEKMTECSVTQEQFKKAARKALEKKIPAHVPGLLWGKIIPAEHDGEIEWKYDMYNTATPVIPTNEKQVKPVRLQKESELGVEWVNYN